MSHFLQRLCISLLLAFSLTSHAFADVPSTTNADYAIKGYDPVAYFDVQKPVVGNPEFTASHGGQKYQFASAKNRDVFTANPDKYAPQYGGYCAFGASRGYKAAVDPAAFTIRDGKLYINHDAKVKAAWEKDVTGYIKLADEKWPTTEKTTKVYQ